MENQKGKIQHFREFKKTKGMFNKTKRKQTLLKCMVSSRLFFCSQLSPRLLDLGRLRWRSCSNWILQTFTFHSFYSTSGHISLIFSSAVLYVLYICFSAEVLFDHTSTCQILCLWNRHFSKLNQEVCSHM